MISGPDNLERTTGIRTIKIRKPDSITLPSQTLASNNENNVSQLLVQGPTKVYLRGQTNQNQTCISNSSTKASQTVIKDQKEINWRRQTNQITKPTKTSNISTSVSSSNSGKWI